MAESFLTDTLTDEQKNVINTYTMWHTIWLAPNVERLPR